MKKSLNLSEIVLAIIIFAGLSLLVFIALNTSNQLKNVATSADVNKIAKSIDHLAISLQHPVATAPAPSPVSEPNAVVVDGNRPVSFNGNDLTVKNIKSCRGEILVRWNYCKIPSSHPIKPAKKTAKKVMASAPYITTKASPVIVENKSYSEENSFNLSDYTPQMVGDYGTTFKMSGHPLYFLSAPYYKKLGYTIPPKWNGQYPMNLNGSYWTYEDRTVTLDYNGMVNKVWIWYVWVGQMTSGWSTYDMYLPHESIKPLLQTYLGREYGEISSGDLKILSQYSSGIADGTIRPNHVIENTARGYKDSHLYEGWEFCTKTQYIYHGTGIVSAK